MLGFGRSKDAPEYTRRLELLIRIGGEYVERFPDDAPHIAAGIDTVPIDWLNQRLEELGETWRAAWGAQGYELRRSAVDGMVGLCAARSWRRLTCPRR